jgi:hypothetical protein
MPADAPILRGDSDDDNRRCALLAVRLEARPDP